MSHGAARTMNDGIHTKRSASQVSFRILLSDIDPPRPMLLTRSKTANMFARLDRWVQTIFAPGIAVVQNDNLYNDNEVGPYVGLGWDDCEKVAISQKFLDLRWERLRLS
jgi:hypothetical protein